MSGQCNLTAVVKITECNLLCSGSFMHRKWQDFVYVRRIESCFLAVSKPSASMLFELKNVRPTKITSLARLAFLDKTWNVSRYLSKRATRSCQSRFILKPAAAHDLIGVRVASLTSSLAWPKPLIHHDKTAINSSSHSLSHSLTHSIQPVFTIHSLSLDRTDALTLLSRFLINLFYFLYISFKLRQSQ